MRSLATAALLLALTAPAAAQSDTDARAGRYDLGKMWTFENAPAAYFTQTYGFRADSAWFARARLSALRIPGCSAAFVSPHGLILTNHHCVRGRLASVAREGETLLDSGFVARTLADERPIPGYFADQLLAALDVTAALEGVDSTSRRAVIDSIQSSLRTRYARPGDSTVVQLVPLYNGARTSAYVFKRYTDIRFVAAAENQMGFFGGDPDNFTFPRYALDFAVLRAYGADGKPMASPHHFGWGGTTGVKEGDPVFVIGSPGRTARLTTMAQLEYLRDHEVPTALAWHRSRIAAMQAYRKEHLAEAERMDIRTLMYSLSNREKSLGGRHEALQDPVIMARRADNERILRDSIRARPALEAKYGRLFDELARVQQEKRKYAADLAALGDLLNGTAGSGTLMRGYWSWRAAEAAATDSAGEAATEARRRLAAAPSWPAELERRYLELQLEDVARAYGPDHPVHRELFGARSPAQLAEAISSGSVLTRGLAADRPIPSDDPAVRAATILGRRMLEVQGPMREVLQRESQLAADIGRARYEIFGAAIPPDGSGSPRIADGVVQGYAYNGTQAPPYTTFYGMYDRFRAFGIGSEWDLPLRWRTPPAGLDLGTPLNFVSTADTYGGNSGSPAVTKDLRLVGLNFDRNINAL
ncbi:MAG TPA: S46 family peptidase, partial [Gemmatimonadales bacterium]|nr:S46 family peptidase [Gemmatimonadales bacterium]